MSTDQTGVNDPASNELTEGAQGRPRSSRRAIRQAERAAEREAILTGQQPLLTRREMRRLREEAAALRAAVEAGEITPEQARALQDPTGQQSQDGGADDGAAPIGQGASRSEPVIQEPEGWQSDDADQTLTAHPAVEHTPSWSAAPAAALDAEPAAAQLGEPTPEAGAQTGGWQSASAASAGSAASVGSAPSASSAASAGSAGRAWRSLTADEAVAISELPTGLMDAVDVPIASAEAERAAAAEVLTEPAPVPTRSSLRERLETGQVPSVTGASQPYGTVPGEDAGQDLPGPAEMEAPVQGGAEPSPYAMASDEGYAAGQEAEPAVPAGAEPHGAAALPQWQSGQEDSSAVQAANAVPVQPWDDQPTGGFGEQAAQPAQPTDAPGAQGAPAAASPGSVRRPIVKIPAAAQGVRTVNISTGELSAVQPVSPSEAGEADGAGPVGDQEFEMPVDEAVQALPDATETGVLDTSEGGSGFDTGEIPQWKSLRERMTTDDSLVGGQQPMSPYSLSGQAPSAEVPGGMPEPAADSFQQEARWDQVASAAAPSDEQADAGGGFSPRVPAQPEPAKSSGLGKVLLILLVVLVVALVLLAVVWYFLSNGSNSAAALAPIGPWDRQLV
ncbi:hypothetical protein ACSL103130_04850 [Actinomyces slackii]|uniref:Uncharacterized protein n=1 Tax=Actinomyces slackii TaxID=52774 RepID=A0A3S4WHD2_9ACTO|nr:hypothetical protein [Actinomyces slackii]VEG74948.1 Uncharacterised protein [Actinomyces slackii]